MHAVVIPAQIEPGREADGVENLRSNVLPQVRQLPGIVSAFWLSPKDGQGLSVLVFENEENARAAAEGIPNAPRPEYVTLDTPEVREVVAQI